MIYPAATWMPGLNAGYRIGKTPMLSAVAHYTVGRDSTVIGVRDGLFQFLVRRDGEVVQFAEADSKCWHAGEPYNSRGPGVEVEFYPALDPDVFTDEARAATALLIDWLETLGIPAEYHDDPNDKRADWRGFISHRSVASDADVHSDYWPQEDWDAMTAPPPAPMKGPSLMTVMFIDFNGVKAYCVQGGIIVHEFHGAPSPVGVPQDALDFVNATSCGLIGMSGAEWAALLKRSGVIA